MTNTVVFEEHDFLTGIDAEFAPTDQPLEEMDQLEAADQIRLIMDETVQDIFKVINRLGVILPDQELSQLRKLGNHRAIELTRVLVCNDNLHADQSVERVQEDRREYGYRRILVDRIEYLFRGHLRAGETTFSRRLIPGILMGLDLILGPDARAQYDAGANRLDKLRQSDPERAAAGIKALQTEILLDISRSFESFDRRNIWLKKMINGHLAPQTETALTECPPEICDHGLHLLLRALFAPLKASMEIDDVKEACAHRFGSDRVENALTVLRRLWGPVIDRPTVLS